MTTQTIKVLVVEDNLLAKKVAEQLLVAEGCSVDVVDTGQKAIEKFKQNHYELVLMDIGLPDMSGNEVTQQMRDYEKMTKSPPSLFLA